MFLDDFRNHCLQKPGVSEGFPFDKRTLVFKVYGKMFALTDVDEFDAINLKCDPEKALDLRERFQAIQPGYHMNKKHWNTVLLRDDVSDQMLLNLVDDSYLLVYDSLPKKVKHENPL
ncbi:MAG: MmcQ/YjbR family DNA-binding protein [Crocinitomicaceae bacterium]|jgi:predicted DNA-binding protein (MmcQ/YjbR family)